MRLLKSSPLSDGNIDVRVEIKMSPELVLRIDRAAGQGARGRFIRAAVERELEHTERKLKKG